MSNKVDRQVVKAQSRKAVLGKLKELRLYLLVVVVAYILVLDLASVFAPLRTNLQNVVFDQYQRWRPREYNFDQPVRILDIDDESIRRVGRWPWPREKMAEMVDKLTKAEVATISFAVLFSEKDQPSDNAQCVTHVFGFSSNGGCEDGDVVFARSIANRPVVLGSVFIRHEKRRSKPDSRQGRFCDRRRCAGTLFGAYVGRNKRDSGTKLLRLG